MSDKAQTFNLGTFSWTVDPTDGAPTLSAREVKPEIAKEAGTVVNKAGNTVTGKLTTPNGEITVNRATDLFLKWQRDNFLSAVKARAAGLAELVSEAANGTFELSSKVDKARGVWSISGTHIGDIDNIRNDMESLAETIRRFNTAG